MKGPAIFVFLVAAAFLTAAVLGFAQYRAQPTHQCMAHPQQTAAAHPYAVYHAQAAMQMNAHYAAQHQAYQQQAWQQQAWHAQAHQATSVAVVSMCQYHQGAHALVATASMTPPPVYQATHASAAMCSTTQRLQYHGGMPTGSPHAFATSVDLSKLNVDSRKYAPATSAHLNAANVGTLHPAAHTAATSAHLNTAKVGASHPVTHTAASSAHLNTANVGTLHPAAHTAASSAHLNTANVGTLHPVAHTAATNLAAPYATPGSTQAATAYAIPAHHHDCADIRSASNLFNIRLQTSQTVNVNVNIYNAGPQLDAASKHGYAGVQPGSDFARTSMHCGCEFNKTSIQNQLIGLDRPMNARHSVPMWSGYAVPNYPMSGSNPAKAYAGNLGAYGPSVGCYANPTYANNAMMTGLYANPMYANNAMMTGLYANPMYANNALMTGLYANPMYANNAMMTGWNANPYADMAMLGGPAAGWYTNMMNADNMMLGYPGFAMQPGMMCADYGWNPNMMQSAYMMQSANMMQSAYMMTALTQMQTATVQNQLLLMDVNFQLAQLQQAAPPGAAAAPQQMFQAQQVQFQNQQQFVQFQQNNVPCQCRPPAYVPQQMPQIQVQMQQQVPFQTHTQTVQHHHMVAQQNLWRPQKW